ncbi:MAG: hypothetical protein RSA08_03455 [Clostridia bacterium]
MENKSIEKLNLNPFFNYKNYETKYKIILQEIFSRRKYLFDYSNDEILLEVMNFCNNVDSIDYIEIEDDILGFYLPSDKKDEGKIILNKTKVESLQKENPFDLISDEIFYALSHSLCHAIQDDKKTGEFGLYSTNTFDKVELLDEIATQTFASIITNFDEESMKRKASIIENHKFYLQLVDLIAASFGYNKIEFLKVTNLKRKGFEDLIAQKLGSKTTSFDIINCFSINLALLYSTISQYGINESLDNKNARKNILNAVASVYSIAIIAMNTRVKTEIPYDNILSYVDKLKNEFSIINKVIFDIMDEINLTLDEKEIVYDSLKDYLNSLNTRIEAFYFVGKNLHLMSQDDIEIAIFNIRESNVLTKMNELASKYELIFEIENEFNYKKYIDTILFKDAINFDNGEIFEYIDKVFNLEKLRIVGLEVVEQQSNDDVKKISEEKIAVCNADEKFDFNDDFSQIDKIIENMMPLKEDNNLENTKTIEIIKDTDLSKEYEKDDKQQNLSKINSISNYIEDVETALSRSNEKELEYEDDLDKGLLDCVKSKQNSSLSLEELIMQAANQSFEEQQEKAYIPIKEKTKNTLNDLDDEQKNYEEKLMQIEEYNSNYKKAENEDQEKYKVEKNNLNYNLEEDFDDEYEDQINLFDNIRDNLKRISIKIKNVFLKKNIPALPAPSNEDFKEEFEYVSTNSKDSTTSFKTEPVVNEDIDQKTYDNHTAKTEQKSEINDESRKIIEEKKEVFSLEKIEKRQSENKEIINEDKMSVKRVRKGRK